MRIKHPTYGGKQHQFSPKLRVESFSPSKPQSKSTMRNYLSAVFFLLLSTCIALTSSTPAPGPLEKRTPPPLTTQLNRANTFYRAVTGREVAHVGTVYPLNGHPTSFLNVPGDFSATGALYVFHELRQAELWGDSHQNVNPSGDKTWYLVQFSYQPATGVTIKSFLTPTNEWKTFVNGCDEGRCPTTYDIIEGPISIYGGARRQAYVDDGKYVYQAAFTDQKALHTLTVAKVTKRTVGKDPESWCPQCNIQ